jgi:hypothetical protein
MPIGARHRRAETALLPRGWEDRLVPIANENTGGITGWCLEIHDLVLSKYAAGRERDLQLNQAVIRLGLASKDCPLERPAGMPLDCSAMERVGARLDSGFGPVEE